MLAVVLIDAQPADGAVAGSGPGPIERGARAAGGDEWRSSRKCATTPAASTGVHTDWPRLVGRGVGAPSVRGSGRRASYAGYANLVDRQLDDHAFLHAGPSAGVFAHGLGAARRLSQQAGPPVPRHRLSDPRQFFQPVRHGLRPDTGRLRLRRLRHRQRDHVPLFRRPGAGTAPSLRRARGATGRSLLLVALPPLDAHRGGHQPHPQRLSGWLFVRKALCSPPRRPDSRPST